MNPLQYPHIESTASWENGQNCWTANGWTVTEQELRSYAYLHFDYPYNHTDLIRNYHLNAYMANRVSLVTNT